MITMPAAPARPAQARRLGIALLLASSLLAACSTTPEAPAVPQASADAQQPLHLSGRFSLSYTEALPETRTEHNSGRFSLTRSADNLGIELYSPFGQTLVRAGQHRGEAAWLETARNQQLAGDSLEDVLTQAIGIPVPADRLPDWLSDRFATIIERSADGQRVRARDHNWHIERDGRRWFLAWQQAGRRLDIRLVLDPH